MDNRVKNVWITNVGIFAVVLGLAVTFSPSEPPIDLLKDEMPAAPVIQGTNGQSMPDTIPWRAIGKFNFIQPDELIKLNNRIVG